MNLTQLHYFQAVCRHGSITNAVEELQISQPSVSSAIKSLEEEFGVPLFERQHRGMTPTPAGRRLLLLVDSLLEHAQQVEQVMQDFGHQRRLLRLGVTPLVGTLVMPQLYASFFKRNPHIQFHVQEATQDELIAQVSSGRLDVAILPHIRPFDSNFRTIPILPMQMACCISLNHPLVNRKVLNIQDVKDEPLVLFHGTSGQSQTVVTRFQEQGLHPNILLYTDQLATMERFVARNLAVGFLYSCFTEHTQKMVGIPLDPPITAQVSVVQKQGGYLFDEMQEFLCFCKYFRF